MGISNYALLMHPRCSSSTRWVRLHKALTKVINFDLSKSGGFVPKLKFGETENLIGVLTQYEILGFCRLALIRLKFYRTKIFVNDISGTNTLSAVVNSYRKLL
jgi:hypothetical protein